MGFAFVLTFVVFTNYTLSQCGPYQVYESFGNTTNPTQGGTWSATSITYGNTSAARSGQYGIVFDAAGDIIQTPLISNPGIFSFWYRRTSTSTGTPQFTIETSPDGSSWTARGTIASFTTSFQQFSVDIGALGLTNIYIRIKDTRASGIASRYLDDLSWTSTVATDNTILIQGSSCLPSIICGVNYKLYDIGGVNDQYNNSMTSAPIIITPASSGGIVTATFSSLATEATNDLVRLYNGNSTSSTQFAGSGFSGSTTPSGSFVSTHSSGSITLDFISDISVVGSGFDINISCSVPTPCTSPPAPGNTLASVTSLTAGSTTNLSLQNTISGSGVSYQWYSNTSNSTSGGTLISGATSATYTATVNGTIWYYCAVTCSGTTVNSTPVQVVVNYCTSNLYTYGCSSYDDYINSLSISNLNQTGTLCTGTTGIVNYTSTTVNFTQGTTYTYTITSGALSEYVGFWIDFNDNGVFSDAGEFIGGTTVSSSSTTITGSVSIPISAATGNHRMRVRLVSGTQQSLTTSCTNYSWGETQDYTANISTACTPPSTQASNVNFTTSSATTGTVTWTSGNGNGAIVVVRATSTSAVLPSNGTVYSANTAFGSGTGSAITGTGNFVVFAGSGNTVSISGLTANTAYTATVYEYNSTGQCYNLTGASAAATTPCAPYTGTYSVGSGTISGEAGHYATLTAAVADYNTRCITGPLVFLLTDATYSTGTGETFPITINSNGYASAVNTLTIKPNMGVTSTITANTSSAPIILNGADYVTIDGSNGTTTNSLCPKVQATRNLTITNTSTNTSSAVVWLQNNGSSNGATNNVIKNCIVTGNSATTTVFGIGSASSTISTSSLGISNTSNQIINNAVSNATIGIYSVGESTLNYNTGTLIYLNDVSSCGRAGIFIGFENGTQISTNTVDGVSNSSTIDALGIGVGLANFDTGSFSPTSECTNTTITYNKIGSIQQTNTYSAAGIIIGSSTAGTYTIQNNFISGVRSNGTGSDYGTGIFIGGGAAQYNVYHNTVAMQGTITGSTSAGTYSVCISVPNSTFKLDLRNNILSNTQIGNSGATVKFGCIYTQASPTFSNFTSNYNDLYCAGTGPGTYQIGFYGGGSAQSTITNWRNNTSLDANSVNVAPVYNTSSDLHLQAIVGNTSLDNTGTNLSISSDIDCETRSSTPDIGADEFSITACTGTPNAGTASITASSGCSSTSFTVSATGLSTGSGISYQWQSSPTGLSGSWTNITGANSASYTTSVSSTTYYQLVTTCSNGGGTNTTNVVSFTIVGNPCTCLTYPAIYANNTADNDLTSVTVGSMTNTSNCGDLAPGTGSIAFRYSNYTGSVAGPSAAQGTSVSFSLTENLCAGGSTNQNNFLIYIDWNQDGDFADANEKMFSQIDSGPSTGLVSTQTVTGSFVVPMTALTGVTRMRVINTGGSFPSYNYAQTDFYTQGETEDYCFTVTSASGPVCPSSASIAPSSTQTICQNGTTTQLTASYTTSGVTGTPTVQYQWYYNTTNSNTVSGATPLSGQTSSTFTPPSTTVGTRYYFCVVYASDNGCAQTNATQSLASNAVQVTIVDPATVTASITQGATASFCSGSSVTLNANTGSGLSYQWQLNGSPIGGANSSTYAASSAGTYTVVVTGSGGCSATSSGTVVSSNPTPTITAQTSTICSGQAFSVSPASAPSGTTYTWSAPTLSPASSITGGSAQASPQATISQTLTNTTTASATATYTVTPTSGTCVGSTFTVTVTVDPPLNYGTAAAVSGSAAVNHLVISQVYGAGGLNGALYNYDYVELFNPTTSTVSINGWSLQYASYNGPTAGGTWSNKVDLNGSIPAGGYFLVSLNTSNSLQGTSIPTADNSGPTIQMAQSDGKVALVNNTTLLSGYCPTTSNIVDFVGFGLADCFEGVDGTPAISKTTAAVRNNHGCEDTNDNLTNFSATTPNPRNSASPLNPCVVSSPTTFCGSGTPGSMSVTGVSGGTSYTYQWYSQTGIVSCPTGNATTGWTSLGSTNGANTATYTPSSAITTSTTYACLVTINGSSCGTTQWASSCVQITINPTPSIANKTTTVCSGTAYTLAASGADVIPSGTTYTWTFVDNASVTGESNGTTQSTFTQTLTNTTTSNQSVVYTVTPTNGSCVGTAFTVTLTVNPSFTIGAIGTNQTICNGTSPNLLTNVSSPAGGSGSYSYQWQQDPGCTGTFTDITGETNPTFQPSTLSQTTCYRRKVVDACGTANSNTVTITITTVANISAMAASTCSGTTFSITPVNGTNGTVPTGTTYAWSAPSGSGFSGGASGIGASSISGTLTNTSGQSTAVYTVSTTTNSCPGSNFTLTLSIEACVPTTACNLVLYKVGDGSNIGATAFPVSIEERNTSTGATVQTLTNLFTGSNLLTQRGTSLLNGMINSYNGFLAVPGHNAAVGTSSVATTNTKAINIIDGNATLATRVLFPTTGTIPYNNDQFRSVIPISSTSFYLSGDGTNTTGGVWYYNGTSFNLINSSPNNSVRNLEIYNNQLFYSTGASPSGIYQIGTGLPTTTQTATAFITYSGGSPNGFSISPDGCTAYIADDASSGSYVGVSKWQKVAGTWTWQYRYNCFARGLVVDYSQSSPRLFVTTGTSVNAACDKVLALTDNGSTFTLDWQQSAGSNYVYVGLDLTPNSYNPVTITQQPSASSGCQNQSQTISATGTSSLAVSYQWFSNSIDDYCGGTIISGANSPSYSPPTSTPGTTYYWVQIKSTCASIVNSNRVSVLVNPNPTATITPSTLCQGSTATLTASGGGTYLWSNGLGTNASVSVSSAGTYSVTVTDSNNCTNTASVSVTTSSPPTIFGISPP